MPSVKALHHARHWLERRQVMRKSFGPPPSPPLQAPASGTAIKVTEAAPEVKKKPCCSSS